MSYLGSWKIDDLLTFYAVTTRFDTGAATDADTAAAYRIYEDETATPILTGTMALLDSANTAGFYSEQITLSAANGFEKGKSYAVYISATVNSVAGATHHTWQIEAEVDANRLNWANIDNPTTAQNLSATNIDVDQIVASVSGAVGSVTGAVGSVTGNVGGNVTGSVGSVATGGITAASLAADAITAAKIADGAIDAATFAAGAITAAAIAADAIGASELAADAVAEIQSGLATAAALDAVDNFLDTEIAAIITTLGTPAGVSISADIAAIEAQTDDIGVAGAGLTAVPWNAAWDAEVQSEVTDAIVAASLDKLVIATGTADSGSTTTMVDAARTEGDNDYWKGRVILFTSGAISGQCAIITDFVAATDTFTLAPPLTQAVSTQTYVILPGLSVWDDTLAEHLISGSTGASLNAAGSAGDPWNTALPGAYGAGTAGKIIGDNVNATISSRATQTSVDTVDDFLDTEIAAIVTTLGTPAGVSISADILVLDNLVDDLESRLTSARAGYLDNLSAGAAATAASIAALNNLSAAQVNAEVVDVIRTDLIPDSYAADGAQPTIAQAILAIQQFLMEKSVSGTTVTIRKPDGSTSALTLTLDSATTPTSITRAS